MTKDLHKLVDGSHWLINTHGIHPCYQSQATHVARNNRLVPVGDNDPICSIPQELEAAIRNLLEWAAPFSSVDTGSVYFKLLNEALSKALRGQCEMHQSLQRRQELEEAEALLTEMCTDAFNSIWDEFDTAGWIPRFKNWWAKRKPKSEREQKLEKVISALRGGGIAEDIAERVLKALGE